MRRFMKKLSYLQSTIVLFGATLFAMPMPQVHAYASSYYAFRLNDSSSIGFQDAQVVAKGNTVYVSSYSDCYVHKIVNNTTSEPIAGIQGRCGHSADGSVAINSVIEAPTSIAVGADGTVYMAMPFAHYVRAVLPDGTLMTIAGDGTNVNGPLRTDASDATQTAFDFPNYVRVSPDNSVYIYDTGVIRRVLADGLTDHVAGAFDAFANNNPYVDGGIATEHALGKLSVKMFFDFDPGANLFITDEDNIYKVDHNDGTIHTYYAHPFNPIVTLEDQPLSELAGLSDAGFEIDSEGNIWFDEGNSTTGVGIRYISAADHIVRTVGGGGNNPTPPLAGSGSPILGTDLQLPTLKSISVDDGQIYFINSFTTANGRIVYYVGRLSTNQDGTPPAIEPVTTPLPNDNGWNNTPVSLSWDVNDTESAITDESGCDLIAITHDIPGAEYTCSATSAGGTASQSVTVKVDSAAPLLGQATWSLNPKPTTGTTTLVLPVTDNNSGIQRAEYFLGDTDPGQGNGTPLNYDGTNLSVTFGSDFSTGVYKINVRAMDNAGNWSPAASDYLVVYNPDGPRMTGKKTIVPTLANGDALPGLTGPSQTDKATFGFSVKYDNQGAINANSDLQLQYSTGTDCNKPTKAQNCHNLSLNASSVAWLTTQGVNHSTGIFQGMGTLVVDGVTNTVIFRVTGVDGSLLSPSASDEFQIKIYSQGDNPNTAAPLYQVNSANIGQGNIKII